MQHTNFQINWDTREYKLQVDSSTIIGTLVKRLDLPSTLVEETPLIAKTQIQQDKSKEVITWIVDEANPNFGWHVPTSLLKAQGYSKR